MNFLKKIEDFLFSAPKPAVNTDSVPPGNTALTALKILLADPHPLCVTLPDANSADLFHANITELLRLTGIEKKIILIPECGRGKLLFPAERPGEPAP